MRTDTFQDITAPRNQVLWLILGFQSGFMNAGGFLACHRFVSHVTGYGTNVGVALGQRNYLAAFELALAPLLFCAGAAFSAILVDRRLIHKQEPRLQLGISLLAALNLVIYFGEQSGYLGEFGEPLELQRDYLLLFCLCFACGLQNGLFTGLTGGKVRTTHLTGPTTDIGLNLVKVYTLDPNDPERRSLALQNWLRLKIVLAFSAGSAIAVLVFDRETYEGFAVPAALSIFLVWYIRKLLTVGGGGPQAKEAADSLLVPATPAQQTD